MVENDRVIKKSIPPGKAECQEMSANVRWFKNSTDWERMNGQYRTSITRRDTNGHAALIRRFSRSEQ